MDVQKAFALLRGMLVEPRATWEAYAAETRPWQYTALNVTLPLVVAAAVLSWILRWLFSGLYVVAAPMGIGSLVLSLVLAFAVVALSAFILAFFAGVFKGVNDFSKAFACYTLALVPSLLGQVLGTIPWIGWIISLAALVWSLVLLYQMIPAFLAVPGDKRPAHYIVSLVVIICVFAVLMSILFRGAMRAG